MARWINLDAICEILEEDIKTGDELVTISWVRSWLLLQSNIIISDSVEAPYNAGYRKASDVAREIGAILSGYNAGNYAEVTLLDKLYELKKKYESEEIK